MTTCQPSALGPVIRCGVAILNVDSACAHSTLSAGEPSDATRASIAHDRVTVTATVNGAFDESAGVGTTAEAATRLQAIPSFRLDTAQTIPEVAHKRMNRACLE